MRPTLASGAAVRVNQEPGALAKGRAELAERLERMLEVIPTDEQRAAFLPLLYDNQQELIGIDKAVAEGPSGDWVHWEPQAWNDVVMKFEPKVRKLLGNATTRKMYSIWPLSTLVYQASLTELLTSDPAS